MYDIIIVGAGPTGSSTAKELASKGYKVLLVEKKSLPRQKSCSGVLIKKSANCKCKLDTRMNKNCSA